MELTKILIATPCYAGLCHAEYVESLLASRDYLALNNVSCDIYFVKSDSLVQRARNSCVARFMSSDSYTHIMFIDSDIVWNPKDIMDLLKSDHDVVGGVYPQKKYQWNVLSSQQKYLDLKSKTEFNKDLNDLDFLRHNMLRYNINCIEGEQAIVNGCLQVKYLATGFMLINRSVIIKMVEAYPDSKYNDDCFYIRDSDRDYTYALFDCMIDKGRYLSEDWTFCQRWLNIGGELYVNVNINLSHIGNHAYRGRVLSSFH